MSQKEPTRCYVYQPDPDTGEKDPRIYALAGPGTEPYQFKRYTKSEADRIADGVNKRNDELLGDE